MNVKILTLKFHNEEPYLEYVEGEAFSISNYIREECQSGYNVAFNHKGFEFDEELVINALTEYFSKQESPINISDLSNMFQDHSTKLDTEEESEIKRITKNYLLSILTT